MYDSINSATSKACLYGKPSFHENGVQRQNYSSRGFSRRRVSCVVIDRQSDVLVGDIVYLRLGGKVSLYGRVTDITSQPARPFVFDHGYCPVLGDGIEFAYAKRFLMVSHPAFGGSPRGEA